MTAAAACPICGKTQPAGLECARVDDLLVISIDTPTLCQAARESQLFYDAAQSGEPITITDPNAFATAVVRALNAEDEIGGTPVTRIFDDAIEQAIESDAGVEFGLPGIAQET